jgi:hypothetical protein
MRNFVHRSSFIVHRSLFIVVLLAGAAFRVSAQPEPWLHPDGTIHYYHAICCPGGIDWYTARDSALGHGGYLATLTSQAEDSLAFGLVDTSSYWYQRPGSGRWAGPWLGGYQPPGSHEPDSGWTWIDFEPFLFRNWTSGEPDNAGDEDALNFGETVSGRVPTWNDLSSSDTAIRGFVRELSADTTTLGLTRLAPGASTGYTLFSPQLSRFTYLIDTKGRLIHSWLSNYPPGFSCYLLQNGNLQRCNRIGNTSFPPDGGGEVQYLDWNSNPVWTYDYSNTQHCQHHDALTLPSGHVLLVVWEVKTRAQAETAGRKPSLLAQRLLPDHVIEVDPANDSIVWQWHVWDHLVQDYDSTKANFGHVAQHSELVDLNFTGAGPLRTAPDWLHMNGLAYNPDLDQVLVSIHNLSEIWVIDHSTTTAQARGHTGGRYGMGGDLLYRWGNPAAYRAGDSTAEKLFSQHNAQWIPAGCPGTGHILIFNNGVGRGYSTVDEIIPACDSFGAYPRPAPGSPFGPAAQTWVYGANPANSFFSQIISGVQRLPDGNTQICNGDNGIFFEVTHDSQTVWRYVNPATDSTRLFQGDTAPIGVQGRQSATFRAPWYPPDYPGLAGHDLTPGYPLENYGSPPTAIADPRPPTPDPFSQTPSLCVTPNPTASSLNPSISYSLPIAGRVSLRLYNATGRLVMTLASGYRNTGASSFIVHRSSLSPGVYLVRLETTGQQVVRKLILE